MGRSFSPSPEFLRPNLLPMPRIALVSMPWPKLNRPSMQLGCLKSFLSHHLPQIQVDAYHFYVHLADMMGFKDYEEISRASFIPEAVFSALLYPDRLDELNKMVNREKRLRHVSVPDKLEPWLPQIEALYDRLFEEADFSSCVLVGFSVALFQLCSTLYAVKKIKSRHPNLPIVLGGPAVAGSMGLSLLRLFPEIDYLVPGEGELPLSALVRFLTGQHDETDAAPLGVILSRRPLVEKEESVSSPHPCFAQVPDLNDLPIPDFSDYFNTVSQLPSLGNLIPTLPVETSRGCYWEASPQGGCRFCNLNLQWQGFRQKPAPKVVSELDHQARTYGTLNFAFVDNAVAPAQVRPIFDGIHDLGKDFRLFMEVRASLSWDKLFSMRRAGVVRIQAGIEALSSRVLKLMNKGVRTIQNLELMRNCTELGIINQANLILEFPGTGPEDVQETLINLEYARYYYPLEAVTFWLGQDSFMARHPDQFGISQIRNDDRAKALFPPAVFNRMVLMQRSFDGRRAQRTIWKPVAAALQRWREDYPALVAGPGADPPFHYLDGLDFLIIRRKRRKTFDSFRLRGASREIYLYCTQIRHYNSLVERFENIAPDKIAAFLADMTAKKLMFREDNLYLSLAVGVDALSRGRVPGLDGQDL
ncbi:MAG: RiPP maturation radical SAM C-methyltransferase [Deltaproteobacteria bacterium]|nr:RiPP maturation radical SAM C-methyltransferase [Deltaproteobacteria bacterium]